jgi:hypothetical protein
MLGAGIMGAFVGLLRGCPVTLGCSFVVVRGRYVCIFRHGVSSSNDFTGTLLKCTTAPAARSSCFRGRAATGKGGDSLRTSLDHAGLKDVSASQDRDKGVVTLGGHVASDGGKSQAESIAGISSGRRGRVEPDCGDSARVAESKAREINSDLDLDLDKGIESNLDAL